jgi:YD repeat-containing protein
MHFNMSRTAILSGFIALLATLVPYEANASTAYVYDQLGRLTTIFYDNGVAVQFTYDADGNQTSSSAITCGTSSLTWGSGIWGCTTWTVP